MVTRLTSEGPKSTKCHNGAANVETEVQAEGSGSPEVRAARQSGPSPLDGYNGAQRGASSFERPRGAQRRTSPFERYNGAQRGARTGSLGGEGRSEERRLDEIRREGSYYEGMASEDGRTPELAGFPVPEGRPERRSLWEQRHEDYEGESARATAVPMLRPRSTEVSGDSAYQTSSTDRPTAPEDTWTPDDAEGILSETKYETSPDTVDPMVKKKIATKEVVSPSPSQRRAKKERRQLHFEEISGTIKSEDDEGNSRPSCAKEVPKKIARETVKNKASSSRNVTLYSLYAWFTWC